MDVGESAYKIIDFWWGFSASSALANVGFFCQPRASFVAFETFPDSRAVLMQPWSHASSCFREALSLMSGL